LFLPNFAGDIMNNELATSQIKLRSYRRRLCLPLIALALVGIPSSYGAWYVRDTDGREAAMAPKVKLGWTFVVDSQPYFKKPTIILPFGATGEDVKRAEREFPGIQSR
jgi:hypothetical protein